MSSTITEVKKSAEKLSESLDSVKLQLLSYASQIQEYLGKVDANVDGYKFSIEGKGEGLSIEIAVRATIHPKISTKTT